ncbi:MAG TPA: sensor histidine kinase [Marmoricola sp.]
MTHTLTQRLDMTADDTAPLSRGPEGDGWWRRLLRDTGYTLTAFPIALVAFVVAVVGLSLGAATLVIGVGFVVLAGTLVVLRGFAHLERLRLRSVRGRTSPVPSYAVARAGDSTVRRLFTPLRDAQSWLDLLWGVLGFATGTTAFAVTVAWWAGSFGGITYWFWQRWLPVDDGTETLASMIGLGVGREPEIWLNLGLGLAGLLLLPVVVRLMATMHASLSWVLLCSRAELQRDVRHAEGGREAARIAEADSLRRLERDIHDGPQQRLVRLQMDLGRAGKQLDQDPRQAKLTIDAAMQQARDTVAELRSLSRGIAPPVLVDRGLVAALQEAFARAPFPVHATIDVPGPLPPHVETTVYFVVSEALTNVAKHSGAGRVEVGVVQVGRRLRVAVTDDGAGGAQVGKGHGLAGLEQRVRAADGTLEITSPAGGPTSLRADLACD